MSRVPASWPGIPPHQQGPAGGGRFFEVGGALRMRSAAHPAPPQQAELIPDREDGPPRLGSGRAAPRVRGRHEPVGGDALVVHGQADGQRAEASGVMARFRRVPPAPPVPERHIAKRTEPRGLRRNSLTSPPAG